MVEGLVGWVTALDPLGVTTASWQAGASTTDKEGFPYSCHTGFPQAPLEGKGRL